MSEIEFAGTLYTAVPETEKESLVSATRQSSILPPTSPCHKPPKRTGLFRPCVWWSENPFVRWRFVFFLLFAIASPTMILIRYFGSSLTGKSYIYGLHCMPTDSVLLFAVSSGLGRGWIGDILQSVCCLPFPYTFRYTASLLRSEYTVHTLCSMY